MNSSPLPFLTPQPTPELADWPVALLAGGLATRLRPITATIPKSLVSVADEPFLFHQLRLLHSHGFRHVVLCVGHLGEMIREEAGDGSVLGMKLEYSLDGDKLLGTGGAIKRALPLLGKAFVVLYGDSFLPMDYGAAVRTFLQSGKPGLMTVFHNHGQWDTSNVVFADGTIRCYDKKELTPEMRHIDYGLGILRSDALAAYPDDAPFDLADIYRDLSRGGQLAGYEVNHRFYEIGSPGGLSELDTLLRQHQRSLHP